MAARSSSDAPALPTPVRALADPIANQVLPSRTAQGALALALVARGGAGPPPPESTALTRRAATGPLATFVDRTLPRRVLDEDTYSGLLEAVITREFFPDLPKLQQQLMWLEALESGDASRIAYAREVIATSMRRASSFVGAPTPAAPAATPAAVLDASSRARASHNSRGVQPRSVLPEAFDSSEADAAALASQGRLAGTKRRREEEEDEGDGSLAAFSAPLRGPGEQQHTHHAHPNSASSAASVTAAEPVPPSLAAAAATDAGRLSLSAWQARYTSEDNASFASNFGSYLSTLRRGHWWAWERPDLRATRLLLADGNAGRVLGTRLLRDDNVLGIRTLTDDPERGKLGMDMRGVLPGWRHRPQNALFWQPELAASRDVSLGDPRLVAQGVTAPAPAAAEGSSSNAPATQSGLKVLTNGPVRLALQDNNTGAAAAPRVLSRQQPDHQGLSSVVSVGGMDIVLASGHVLKPNGGLRAPQQLRRDNTRLGTSRLRDALAAAPAGEASAATAAAASRGVPKPRGPTITYDAAGAPLINGYGMIATPLIPQIALQPPPGAYAAQPPPDLGLDTVILPGLEGVVAGLGGSGGGQFRVQGTPAREATADALLEAAAATKRRRVETAAAAAVSVVTGGASVRGASVARGIGAATPSFSSVHGPIFPPASVRAAAAAGATGFGGATGGGRRLLGAGATPTPMLFPSALGPGAASVRGTGRPAGVASSSSAAAPPPGSLTPISRAVLEAAARAREVRKRNSGGGANLPSF